MFSRLRVSSIKSLCILCMSHWLIYVLLKNLYALLYFAGLKLTICLSSHSDVHVHMLASEKVGLVTWAWEVNHRKHQQNDKAKGKDSYIVLLICLPNKYPDLLIHLCHDKYDDVICNTYFAVHKKYWRTQVKRPT